MAERRRQKKQSARPREEAKRRSLLDLPPAVEPRGDAPTNPVIVVRPSRNTSLPPAPTEPLGDMSLASLALATRRGAADLMERMSTNRPLSDYPPRASAPPAPPPPSARPPLTPLAFEAQASPASPTDPSPPPDFQSPSAPPPAVQVPSEPPGAREPRAGKLWLRTLGVIVLSASVGAAVSSLISEVKSELRPLAAQREPAPEARVVVAAPACTTAAPAPEPKPALATPPLEPKPVLATALVAPERALQATPRISVDTLPLQQQGRRRVTSAEPPHAADPSPREQTQATPKIVLHEAPLQPARSAVADAVRRAAWGAKSCDSGPQDGAVTITFAPSGGVSSVTLAKGFGDATLNACVLRAFGRAKVPAFSGEPIRVRKRIAW